MNTPAKLRRAPKKYSRGFGAAAGDSYSDPFMDQYEKAEVVMRYSFRVLIVTAFICLTSLSSFFAFTRFSL